MKFVKVFKVPPALAVLTFGIFSVAEILSNAQAGQTSRVQTHRFNMEDCGFALKINVAKWERQTKLFDTYLASKTKNHADKERVFIQAIGRRKTHLGDPAANLFDAKNCVAQELGNETTASGLRIRLQEVDCSHQSFATDSSHSPTEQHRLYGTVDGHWSSLGAGLFASSKEDVAKYKPELVQILKTLKHLCPFEFLPLKTGATAELEAQKAADLAVEKAVAIAGAAQKAAENAAKLAEKKSPESDARPRQTERRPVPPAREWRMVLGNQCKFAFQTVQGKWGPDTFEGTEALIPIGSKSKSKIFLTAANYWIIQGDSGAWSATTSKNCTVERRGTLKTADGQEAPLFLASNCQQNADFSANFNKKHLLYGYVRRANNDADYMVLASDNRSFLVKHEDELISIIESHTTQLPRCLNYRNPN